MSSAWKTVGSCFRMLAVIFVSDICTWVVVCVSVSVCVCVCVRSSLQLNCEKQWKMRWWAIYFGLSYVVFVSTAWKTVGSCFRMLTVILVLDIYTCAVCMCGCVCVCVCVCDPLYPPFMNHPKWTLATTKTVGQNCPRQGLRQKHQAETTADIMGHRSSSNIWLRMIRMMIDIIVIFLWWSI